MAEKIKRVGFGQVEPNHLSAQKTGQIYAQLPVKSDIKILENGQFAKYDYANGEVNYTGEGEWMLVFNEVKLYDDAWRESYKDFALIKENMVGGEMTPRLLKTNIGDIFTTNCLEVANTSGKREVETTESYDVGDKLGVAATGYLSKAAINDGYKGPVFKIVKIYTLADMQPAVKVQRIG